MQAKKIIELLIRSIFAVWFFISLIGFLWFANSRDETETLAFLVLIATLLFSTAKSIKSVRIFVYVIMNTFGLLSSCFLGYKTIFVYKSTPLLPYLLPNILLSIFFIILIYFSLSQDQVNKQKK